MPLNKEYALTLLNACQKDMGHIKEGYRQQTREFLDKDDAATADFLENLAHVLILAFPTEKCDIKKRRQQIIDKISSLPPERVMSILQMACIAWVDLLKDVLKEKLPELN